MIKFTYLCDQSEEKKKECKQYLHLCNPCAHTTDRKHAMNIKGIFYGDWEADDILEKFECLEGQDVVLYEKEDKDGNNS